jgi:hypothetical protein
MLRIEEVSSALWMYALAVGCFIFGQNLPGLVLFAPSFLYSVKLILMEYHSDLMHFSSAATILLLASALCLIPYDVSITWAVILATTPFMAMRWVASWKPGLSLPRYLEVLAHE